MYKNAAKYAQHFREVTGKSVSSTGPANTIKKRKQPKEKPLKTSTQNLSTQKPVKRLIKAPIKKQTTKQVENELYKENYTGPTAMQMAFMHLEDVIRNSDNPKSPKK
jgi:hypothetical protein